MATALKKIIQIAKDIYAKVEADRWGNKEFALPASKLPILVQLLDIPLSDQHLVTLLDLEIAKAPKAEVEVMKMNMANSTIETILRILRNCALTTINQLAVDKAKAENEKLMAELETNIGQLFGMPGIAQRTVEFYDPDNTFANELNAIYAEVTAEKEKVMVAVTVEPDQAPMTAYEVEKLKTTVKNLRDSVEALTYSYNKKVRDVSGLMDDLKLSTEEVTALREQLMSTEDVNQKNLTEISLLRSNLKHAEDLREVWARTQAQLEKRIETLETALKSQADTKAAAGNRYRFTNPNTIISATSNNNQAETKQPADSLTQLRTILKV